MNDVARWIMLVVSLAAAGSALAESVPLPPERPPDFGGIPLPLPREQPHQTQTHDNAHEPGPATSPPDDEIACRKRLTDIGVIFEPLPAIAEGECGAAFPLRATKLPGEVSLPPGLSLTCDAIEQLALWTRDSVQAEAETALKRRLSRVLVGTTYQCRGRNRDPSAKLSEHAFANGLDVAGFAFDDKSTLMVRAQEDGTPEAAFQASVRASACRFFTTVLGPGVEAHEDHLHLDVRRRSRGYRLCQ